jgi:probable HAF family extracellular repeat protein
MFAHLVSAQIYKVTDLGTFPGGTVSQGQAINQFGQIAGYARFANFNAHGIFWSDFTGLVNLPSIPPESNFAIAQAINNRGEMAGYSNYNQYQNSHAVLWTQGKLIDLGALNGGTLSEATGINDEGVVVGFSNSSISEPHAFLWTLGTGMVDLGTLPGGYYSQALAVNQRGDIACYSNAADAAWHACVRPRSGEMQSLPSLPGGGNASANAINDLGQLAGGSGYNGCGFCTAAVIWANGNVQNLGYLPGQGWSSAFGINNKGQVIGWSGFLAFIWSAEKGMRNLNDLIPADSGWQLSLPTGINDCGQITGQGTINGQSHGFLLTPIGAVMDNAGRCTQR